MFANEADSGTCFPLNESPSEKEGKSRQPRRDREREHPSMKVPPKRKGNGFLLRYSSQVLSTLNESPSEKEGKSLSAVLASTSGRTLNESPSEKEGKS